MQRLVDKIAIVTGAAKGIGFAVAQSLGRDGASVMLSDIDDSAADTAVSRLSEQGIKAVYTHCDVSKRDQVQHLISQTVQQLGGVDIMVANAGIVKSAPFLEMSEEDFDAVIAVNLKGVFLTCQAAAQQMVKQGRKVHRPSLTPLEGIISWCRNRWARTLAVRRLPGNLGGAIGLSTCLGDICRRGGSMITMSSVNGVTAIPTIAGYNASKGGIDNLTRCMSLALAPHNIRVNAIGPGSIETEVLASVVSDKAQMEKVLSRTPLGRIGQPEEIGSVAVFLASQESSYITGQTIYVDGGRLALNYTVPVPAQGK